MNWEKVRLDFPILFSRVRGKPLVYLDNAATTQKPRRVIEGIQHYYEHTNSNVHRGLHALSEKATEEFENSRRIVRRFLTAPAEAEVIFVRGATEGINLVAQSYGERFVGPGDEILVTTLEHHSNIVPWQLLCERKRARLKVIPINDVGDLDLSQLEGLLTPRTRMLAVTQVSNALGTVTPLGEVITAAHRAGVPVLVDGAQGAPHLAQDVGRLDCDFYVFSGHKIFGPTGIGVLYGKRRYLEEMPPYQGGGEMIERVTFAETTFNVLPYKFEAGTPHIEGAIGLGIALGYLMDLGLEEVEKRERELLSYALERLSGISYVKIIGHPGKRVGVIPFLIEGIHPHDVGTILDGDGIAIRAGHHCAQPLMERLGLEASCRASLAFYNTHEDIDRLLDGIKKVKGVFFR